MDLNLIYGLLQTDGVLKFSKKMLLEKSFSTSQIMNGCPYLNVATPSLFAYSVEGCNHSLALGLNEDTKG